MKETIYKLFRGNDIIYIGKTQNLHKRLQQHKHTKCYSFTKATIVNTSKLRKTFGNSVIKMENYLIAKHKPKFNIIGNPDKLQTQEEYRLKHNKRAKGYYKLNSTKILALAKEKRTGK